jgi:hypothetical protein
MKQYGARKIADDVSAAWQGGEYVTFHRKAKTASTASPTTADLALLYVSRWTTPQAAERFARFYISAVAQRYQTVTPQPVAACSGTNCPVSRAQIMTEEGPVLVEHWGDNSVIVSESFDLTTADKVHTAVRDQASSVHADSSPQDEIGLRLYEIPAFRRIAQEIGIQIAREITLDPTR